MGIVHPDDIIKLNKKNELILGGKVANETQIESIMFKAEELKTNKFLKTILNTIRKKSEENIMYHADNMEKVHNNRMAIYVVGEIEKMIELPGNYRKAVEKLKKTLQEGI